MATTMAAFYTDDPDTWGAWLYPAEYMVAEAIQRGDEFGIFAALQVDKRGIEPFAPLLARFREITDKFPNVEVKWWTYSLDDGRTKVTTHNRLRHITCGQNLCNDFAVADGYDYMLFMASDCEPTHDAPWKLAETGRQYDAHIVGGHVPTYCLDGPPAWYAFSEYYSLAEGLSDPGKDVRAHMPTAAFVQLNREAFRLLRWRWDLDAGMSDDPCLYADATARDMIVVVDHEVIGQHYPETIGAVETRGHDMKVVR
jgi:hypothetical protein